jgi:hypothetical protein
MIILEQKTQLNLFKKTKNFLLVDSAHYRKFTAINTPLRYIAVSI